MVGAGGGGAEAQIAWCTIQQDTRCGWYSGAGGGGGGYEVVDASGLAAGTPITINVGSGGTTVNSGTGCASGCVSNSGGPSNVIATNLAASAGGGGGGTSASEIYAGACDASHSSVPGGGGTNSYSGSAITSVVTNDAGSTAPWNAISDSCASAPGGNGGNSGGNMGTGGSGGTSTAGGGAGGPYGGGGGGGSDGGIYGGAGAGGEVIISWN